MKTLKFIIMAFLLMSVGCSTENEEDFAIESSNFKLSEANLSAKLVTRPFNYKAYGDWFIVESTECNGLLQYAIIGNGIATHLGLIKIEGKICTLPQENLYFFTVKHTAANGDELIWESVNVNINEEGLFEGGDFECIGGTGRFSNVEGAISVNEFLTVTAFDEGTGLPLAGTFSNSGTGTITF